MPEFTFVIYGLIQQRWSQDKIDIDTAGQFFVAQTASMLESRQCRTHNQAACHQGTEACMERPRRNGLQEALCE